MMSSNYIVHPYWNMLFGVLRLRCTATGCWYLERAGECWPPLFCRFSNWLRRERLVVFWGARCWGGYL